MPSTTSAGPSLFSTRMLLALLLAVVVAALIVAWRLGFNAHSGQAAAFVFAALAACFLLAQFVRRRFKLSMRTLLIAMTILGVLFGLVGARVMESRRHQAAVARVEQLGGAVRYNLQPRYDESGWADVGLGLPMPAWAFKVLGDDMFRAVVAISLWHSSAADDDLAQMVEDFPRLEEIDLGTSRVTENGLTHVSALADLRRLQLNGLQATHEGFQRIENASNIDTLTLLDPGITGRTLQALSACQNLEALFLWGNQLNDADLAHLSQVPQLTFLQINCPLITDNGLQPLSELPRLKSLYLNSTKITDAGLVHLRQIKSLEHLHLPAQISDEAVAELQAALPQCNIVK